MKVVAVFVLVILGLAKSSIIRDVSSDEECPRSQMFNDYMEVIKSGEVWRERCRTCRCEGGSITCALDSGKTCDLPYDPSMDRMCVQWDADSCCCLKTGCSVGGQVYAIGEEYTEESGNGCQLTCTCSAFKYDCFFQCIAPLAMQKPSPSSPDVQ